MLLSKEYREKQRILLQKKQLGYQTFQNLGGTKSSLYDKRHRPSTDFKFKSGSFDLNGRKHSSDS